MPTYDRRDKDRKDGSEDDKSFGFPMNIKSVRRFSKYIFYVVLIVLFVLLCIFSLDKIFVN